MPLGVGNPIPVLHVLFENVLQDGVAHPGQQENHFQDYNTDAMAHLVFTPLVIGPHSPFAYVIYRNRTVKDQYDLNFNPGSVSFSGRLANVLTPGPNAPYPFKVGQTYDFTFKQVGNKFTLLAADGSTVLEWTDPANLLPWGGSFSLVTNRDSKVLWVSAEFAPL